MPSGEVQSFFRRGRKRHYEFAITCSHKQINYDVVTLRKNK